ncbi:hypothetical protein [Mucilaginibacter sp. KACC 22063]|uniref:hypothetical protein n=1 Tax=Mucilaginibacter sp. KACC 22063 TaxID=3025666 RepID=UPI002365E779|nr:hypothetical protein [Mucilaginibacter sp. KACC 22063]WDF55477.1 hypothetical protein PQ461_00195 [Mucilaginibacter sp. KACC 22063]
MKILAFACGLFMLSACASQQETKTKCGSVVCTEEFIMIPVKVIATKSSEINFKTYKVINLNTGKEVKSNGWPGKDNPGTVVVADDGHRHDFTEQGTALQLQITRNDGRVVKQDYKIGGGRCACHVSKISGPDQVDIDQ